MLQHVDNGLPGLWTEVSVCKISNVHQRVLLASGNSYSSLLHPELIASIVFQSMQGFRCPLCLGDDSGAGGLTGQKPGSNVG